jgi:hypothetical protein
LESRRYTSTSTSGSASGSCSTERKCVRGSSWPPACVHSLTAALDRR